MPNLSIVEKVSTPSTTIIGPLLCSTDTIPPIVLLKLSIVDKVCSPPTKSIDPLPFSTVKSTTINISHSSIVKTVCTTSTQSVAYMDIRVRHLKIETGSSNEIKLYELQVQITCTISEFTTIMLSQTDINVSRYRVILVYFGKHLHDFNVNDKLSNHGIKKRLVH